MNHEATVPASSARSVLAPALRGMPRHKEVRSDQTTTGAEQALDERRGDPERRVRVKDGLAFYRVAPLIVALEILPDDRIVRVLNVDVL